MQRHSSHHSPLLRRLIFSSTIRLAGIIIAMLAGLVVSPYMLNKLGANDCGLLSIVTAIVTLLSFFELGLQSAINRHLAASLGLKDDDALCQYFNSALFLYTGVAVCVFFLACLTAFQLEPLIVSSRRTMAWLGLNLVPQTLENLKRNITLAQIILVMSAFQFGLMLLPRIQCGIVAGSLRDDILSTVNLVQRILRPCVTLIVLFFGGHLIALLTGFILLGASFIPVWQFFVRQLAPQLKLSFRFVQWATIKELYRFSFFAFAAFASSSITLAFSLLFITFFLGLESVACYQMVCVTLFSVGKEVVITLTNYLSPIFAQLNAQKRTAAMHKTLFFSIKVSTGIALFIAFGFIAWGHPFISRWMSGHTEMLAAYPPLVLLSLILLLEQAQAPAVEFLYGTGTHKYYAWLNTVEAVIALSLLPVLTFSFHLTGVAAALLTASVIVRTLLQPYYVSKVLELPCRIYYGKFFTISCGGIAALLLPAAVTCFLVSASFARLLLTGCVCTVLYAAVYIPLVFTVEERYLVWNAVKKRR